MTAVIIWRENGAVHIATDGAGYLPNGKLGMQVAKTYPLPHLKMAIAVRGSMSHAFAALRTIQTVCTSFDDFRARATEIARAIRFSTLLYGHFDLFAAGVSETDGPTAFMVFSHSRHFADVPAFEPRDMDERPLIFPGFPDESFSRFTAHDVVPTMERQRRRELPTQSGWLPFANGKRQLRAAGSFVQVTSVNPNGSMGTWIAHRWNKVP